MGREIPTALGVRMADPEAGEILLAIGDGTLDALARDSAG